jgi:uncharacterized protein YajQ (UPF0234 family)
MPSFDVVSEIDMQEIRNALDQANREIGNRYDFKNTGSSLELNEMSITLSTSSEDRLIALRQVLEEKLVRRQISLSISYEEVQEASQATVRQIVTLQAGISSEKAKELNKFIKALSVKGVQSQTQGEQLRVISKKRDDLQTVMSELKSSNFDLPLQFENFRD